MVLHLIGLLDDKLNWVSHFLCNLPKKKKKQKGMHCPCIPLVHCIVWC